MPRAKPCPCGCGLAPAATCRQRLLECDGCGVKLRMAREALAQVTVSCSCGGAYVPICRMDQACAGDEDAYAEVMGRLTFSEVQSRRAKAGQAKRASRAAYAAMSDVERARVLTANSAMAAVFSPGQVREAEQLVEADTCPF